MLAEADKERRLVGRSAKRNDEQTNYLRMSRVVRAAGNERKVDGSEVRKAWIQIGNNREKEEGGPLNQRMIELNE